MSIALTEKAIAQVKALMKEHGLDGHVVRVAVDKASADGLVYALDLVDEVNDPDRTFEQDGVKVVCDPRSYLYLKGATVDFVSGGFAFNNPRHA